MIAKYNPKGQHLCCLENVIGEPLEFQEVNRLSDGTRKFMCTDKNAAQTFSCTEHDLEFEDDSLQASG